MSEAAQTCSQCGWAFDMEALRANACRKCRSAILVTSVALLERFDPPAIRKYVEQYSAALKAKPDDRDALLALGICYLRLGLFDLAERFLQRLVDAHPADPSGYFYRAISVFKGKRPKTASMSVVRQSEQLVQAAHELDPSNGRYDLLLAAIRRDYYVANGLRVPEPSPEALAVGAKSKIVDQAELSQARSLLKLACSEPNSRV